MRIADMITSLNQFTVCPNCGSTKYFVGYPFEGKFGCARCLNEVLKVSLREMAIAEILVQKCPFCGKEGEEGDTLFDDDYVIVFKCKGCGKLDGYAVTSRTKR
jgi:hypothetical protein